MTVFQKTFFVDDREVGEGHRCFIVAEAGVSHFGSINKAFALVDSAVNAGADAVKFQVFRTSELISRSETEWTERMHSKELPPEAFRDIRDYCKRRGIIFFATAHDLHSLDELVNLDPPLYKIGSGEVKNPEYFEAVARLGKPVVFSTGMYSLSDFDQSLSALSKGGCSRVAVMHCVTRYPTPPREANLMRILTLKEIFPGPVGYSDHCATHDIATASVLLGANMIEKHITLEKDIPNAQDWKVACTPRELIEFVTAIRRLEAALGDGEFGPTAGEKESIIWARKSIFASRDLSSGTCLTAEDIVFKRPGTGISPDRVSEVLGKRLVKSICKDEAIFLDDLNAV